MQNLNKPRPNKSLIFGSINVGWFFVKQGHGSCLVVLNDYNQVSFECIRLSLVGYIFNTLHRTNYVVLLWTESILVQSNRGRVNITSEKNYQEKKKDTIV